MNTHNKVEINQKFKKNKKEAAGMIGSLLSYRAGYLNAFREEYT
jgi:hypothetical protein